ncbi:MAG: class I SAM-dependent methyltransferase [Planctomycetes bacterium]|nr:class I SAM-dependent methyltransferase [Planctomycetota bacterium]
MSGHVCPWWGGYFIDNPLRRLIHPPRRILAPYVHSGMTVLDFGCGMGVFSIPMASLVGPTGRVIAVDLQQEMLRVLAKRARRAGVADRIRLYQCEADSLEVTDPVDFVLAFYSVHEVPNVRRLWADLFACLRPSGSLLWVEPIGHVPKRMFAEMLKSAEESGFRLRDRPRIRLSHSALLVKP